MILQTVLTACRSRQHLRLILALRRADLPGGQQVFTFRWGKPGSGPRFRGGSGLSHIIAKHGVKLVGGVSKYRQR